MAFSPCSLFRACAVAFLLIVGPRMIAEGGIRTTKGWNLLNIHEQKSNLIRALTQEWVMNSRKLLSPPMKGETHYVKEDGGTGRRPFFILTTYALQAVLSSGLWDYSNQIDSEFLDALVNYEMKVTFANREFREWDDFLSKIKDPNESIMQTKKVIRLICEKDWFKSLGDWQNQVAKLIWSQYRWAIETQWPEAYEPLRQKFQDKSTPSEPAEDLSKKEL